MDTPLEPAPLIHDSLLDWRDIKFDSAPFVIEAMLMDQTLKVYSSGGKEVISIEPGLRDLLGERDVQLVITKDNIDQILESLTVKPTLVGRPCPLE